LISEQIEKPSGVKYRLPDGTWQRVFTKTYSFDTPYKDFSKKIIPIINELNKNKKQEMFQLNINIKVMEKTQNL